MRLWKKKKGDKIHLDEPKKQLFAQHTQFVGWYAGDCALEQIFVFDRKIDKVKLHARIDVSEAHPKHQYCTGFSFEFPTEELCGVDEVEITASNVKGQTITSEFQLEANAAWEIKKRKLKALPSILELQRKHSKSNTSYDFIDQNAIDQAGIVKATAVSSHSYTPEMIEMINDVPRYGWVLDCGSGYRNTEYENVVLFEIEPYISTDVRGINESLPFKDNSFDLILSIVVLEHVRDPRLAVSEMIRVLKPGGKIWVDVAFMQPFHGYPNHFFNMTKYGLRSLFSENMQIEQEFVPKYGTPIWALTWFLQSYAQGLPEGIRSDFENLSIRDLLKQPEEIINKNWVSELSVNTTEHLAATNTLIAKKLT